jgi:hypothetical protein
MTMSFLQAYGEFWHGEFEWTLAVPHGRDLDEPLLLAGLQPMLLATDRKAQSRFAWDDFDGH